MPVAAAAPFVKKAFHRAVSRNTGKCSECLFINICSDPKKTQQHSVKLGVHKIVAIAPRTKLLHTDKGVLVPGILYVGRELLYISIYV